MKHTWAVIDRVKKSSVHRILEKGIQGICKSAKKIYEIKKKIIRTGQSLPKTADINQGFEKSVIFHLNYVTFALMTEKMEGMHTIPVKQNMSRCRYSSLCRWLICNWIEGE